MQKVTGSSPVSSTKIGEAAMKLLDSLHDEHDIEIFDMLLILYWDYDVAYEAQIGMD